MSRDLDQLLRDTAAVPDERPDPASLVRRGRRRRRRRHAAGAASAVAAVLALGVVGMQAWPSPAPQIVDQPEDAAPAPEQPAPTPDDTTQPDPDAAAMPEAQPLSWPDGPSQSPEDAAAQGVPSEVAALPLAARLDLRGATQAAEGVYVHSSLPFDTADELGINTPLADGAYPMEYRELLLLDPDTLAIERAWPVAGLYFHESPTVLDDPNVVVMAGGSDGANPWSGVVVIDRGTAERRGWAQIRDEAESWPEAQPLNNDWVRIVPTGESLPSLIFGAVDGLLISPVVSFEWEELVLFDPLTLEVVRRIDADDGLPPDARWVGDRVLVAGDGIGPDEPLIEITADGLVPRTDLPPFLGPDYVAGADLAPRPMIQTVREGACGLWVLQDDAWVGTHESSNCYDAHTTPSGRTWATTYVGRTGGVLLRDGELVAERTIAGPYDSGGAHGPVVAERSDGTILWIANGVPHIVDLGGAEQTELASKPPCDKMPAWTQLPAVFYVCDGPNTFAVGVTPTDRDASLQELLDQLRSVPDDAATAGMTTVFGDIEPPTISVDGTTATLDFDDTLEEAFAQSYMSTYVLEQTLTTVWVNSAVDTIRVTLNGDCDAAAGALGTVPCPIYGRADGNNTLRAGGLAAQTVWLHHELERLIHDAGFEPLGGDHDIGNATETIDDGSGEASLSLYTAADATAYGMYDDVEVYEERNVGRVDIELGVRPDGLDSAILRGSCVDYVLMIGIWDSTNDDRQRVERLALAFAAATNCGSDG